ncbi:TIGR04283 family arsenosugar biosynthesis glycosyltransferase [soil metagenome]
MLWQKLSLLLNQHSTKIHKYIPGMLSIIIPTYNEGDYIKATIQQLWENDTQNLITEIIVADGGSTDDTCGIASSEGVRVVNCPKKGRAAQMNFGAGYALSETLYFLHADTIPPINFTTMITDAIKQGFGAGCFMLSFNHPNWFLKANCWFTRFDIDAIRFGDQSLFVTKKAFQQAGGFCEKHIVLEDQHLIKRLKKLTRFTIIKNPVVTSARKYLINGIYKTQAVFFYIYLKYRMGFSQQQLITTYRQLIKQDKL